MKVLLFTMFLAIFVVVEITSAPQDFEKELEKWVRTCQGELGISKEKMEAYQTMTELPTDRLSNCLTACILEKAEILVKGKIDKGKILEVVDLIEKEPGMKDVRKAAEKCHGEADTKTDKCDAAGAFSVCMYVAVKPEIEKRH